MILSIFRKPTISSAIAFGFVVLAFCIGYGLNKLPLPQTDQEKLFYNTLLTVVFPYISWSVISGVINASIEAQAEDKANEKAKENVSNTINRYQNQLSQELDQIKTQLKNLNLKGHSISDSLRGIAKIEEEIDVWMEKDNAAQEVIKWLKVKNNRKNLAKSVVSDVFAKENFTRKQKNLFYLDILSCLSWLQTTFENNFQTPTWRRDKLATAINENIHDGLKLYKLALDLIKEKDELKKLDNRTGVVKEYTEHLKLLYDEHLNE